MYINRSLAALLPLLLLFCLPAAANLYIAVSQEVVTVAVVLKVCACVGRDQHLHCCMLLAIPTEASARMCSCFTSSQFALAPPNLCHEYDNY